MKHEHTHTHDSRIQNEVTILQNVKYKMRIREEEKQSETPNTQFYLFYCALCIHNYNHTNISQTQNTKYRRKLNLKAANERRNKEKKNFHQIHSLSFPFFC